MATKKKESGPVENSSEKTCPACGYVNSNEAGFCSNCGNRLNSGKQCRNCGAPISDDSKFCIQCGCPTVEDKFCPLCGTKVSDDYKFCPKCGASSQGSYARTQNYAPPMSGYAAPQQNYMPPEYAVPPQNYAPPPPPQPKKPFRQKVVDFENKRHLLSNLVVLVMSFLFVLVALFAPIKVAVNGFSGVSNGSGGVSNLNGVNQSIFQVFDAYEYIGLNYNDTRDKRMIDEMGAEFRTAVKNASNSFSLWYALHQDATEQEAAAKLYEYLMNEMDDMNMLGFMLVLTTPGVYDAWSGEFGFNGTEETLGDALDCTYYSAVYSLVVATLIALLQIAIAVISLVFMIIAICNLVHKKPSKPFKYLFLSLLLSGIALIVTMIAPNLIPGGAVLAIGILSTLAYIACGMAAFTQKDNYLVMIRRCILCVLGLIVFFSVTADNIRFYEDIYEVGSGGVDLTGSAVDGSFGLGISGLLSYFFIYSLNGLNVSFTPASASAMVFVSVLGIATTTVLFFMLLCYLRSLRNPDGKSTGRIGTWLTVAGVACMLLIAIGSAILGSIGYIPSSGSTNYMLVKLYANANSGFYATLVFAVIAIVFDFVYSAAALKKPPQQAVAAAQDGDAAEAPAAPDSVSSNDGSALPPAENA